MKVILGFIVICLAVSLCYGADAKLSCYQCDPSTSECKAKDAKEVVCGAGAVCQKATKKGATDTSKALRKCVIADATTKQPLCPKDYSCDNCDKKLCNAASALKFAWVALAGITFRFLL